MTWTIREYRERDEEGICRLLSATFGNFTLEEWRWKYAGDYLPNRAWIDLGADDEGNIVAHYVSLPRILRMGENEYLVAMPCEYAIDMKYRRSLKKKGIGVAVFERQIELQKEIPEKVYLGFGYVNRAHYRFGKRLLNYKDLCSLDMLEYDVFRIPNSLSRFQIRGVRGLIWRLFAYPAMIIKRRRAHSWKKRFEINRIQRFRPEFDRFYSKFVRLYPVGLRMDSRYLNGRFFDRPDVDYEVFTCSVDGELAGYTICRIRDGVGLLVDLRSLDDPLVTRCLLDQALWYFARNRIGIVRGLFLPGTFLYGELDGFGFVRTGDTANVVYWIFFEEEIDEKMFTDMKNWHMTYGIFDDV